MDAIKNYLESVTAPQDKIFKRESNHCLEIQISTHRKELLEKWMYKRYRPVKSYEEGDSQGNSLSTSSNGGSAEGGGTCRLKIESVSNANSQTDSFSVGQKNRLNTTQTISSGSRTSSMLIGVGFSGFLQVNDERVELLCQRAGGTGYRVSLNLQGNNGGIGTALEVRKGQRINIGDIVNDLSRKSRSVGIPKGADIQKTTGSDSIKYFLIAE